MGTEVLRPQDFLYDRFRLSPPAFHRRKSYFPNGNGFGYPRPNNSGYRKPSLPRLERSERKRKNSPPPPPQPLPQRQSSPPPQLLQSELPHQIPRRSSSSDELQTHQNKPGAQTQNNLPRMGGVTILRRGQSLDTIDASRMKRDLNNKARGGLMKKKYMDEDDVYAGSAFFVSPSPSSLPLPSFFNMNNQITMKKDDEFQDSATRDLRRLLRLE